MTTGPRTSRGVLDPDRVGADLLHFLERFERALTDLAGGEGAPEGFDPRPFIAPGVPRVRPLLVILSARAVAREDRAHDPAAAEQAAVAAELLHAAILVHDATLGRPGGRRRRAARRIIGSAVGLLGGNHLSLRALELVRATPTPELMGDVLEAMREIAEAHAVAQKARGRLLSPDEATALLEGHAGAVFSFACRAGARLAGADRKDLAALARYGRHTGVAWALVEELAGYQEARSQLDAGPPLRSGLLLAFAAEVDPEVNERYRRLAGRPDRNALRDLIARVEASGAPARVRQRAVQEVFSGRSALSGLEASGAREALDNIAARLARPNSGGPQGQA